MPASATPTVVPTDGGSDHHRERSASDEISFKKNSEGYGDVETKVVDAQAGTTMVAVADDFPDGGLRAWLIVVGAMCNTFATFGYVNSWGIFQNHYEQTILNDVPPSNIAWIGSIQYSLVFFPSLIVGRLFDLGYFRVIFVISSALIVVATFLIPQCHAYWQFLLVQGFLVGLGCGGIFGPTTAIIAHWFKKKRGTAMGLVAVGSAVGGTVIPVTAQNLLPRIGFEWTMRVIGFIILAVLGLANLLLKRRLPPRRVSGGLFNFAAFKSPAFSIYCASSFTTFLGIYTLLTYIGVTATQIGVSEQFAFYFVAIANASGLLGRYTAGMLSDRIGSMNIMIPFTALAGVLTFIWPFADSKGSLIAVTVVYGLCSGSYVSLLSNPIMDMGETADVGRRVGTLLTITAVGALAGPPISGAIGASPGGFKAVGYYAGSAVLVGVGLMVITRQIMLKKLLGKI